MTIAAEIDKSGLQGRFHPRDFREVDISFDLFFEGGLDIVFIETVSGCDDDPNLFRVSAIHKHALRHFFLRPDNTPIVRTTDGGVVGPARPPAPPSTCRMGCLP